MKEIQLTRGGVAFVDDADYEEISKYKWQLRPKPGGVVFYAARSYWFEKRKIVNVYMHRHIVMPPATHLIDHIDGNGLNNQRANLRIVTVRENLWNTKINRDIPVTIGTSFNKKSGRYSAKTSFMRHGERHNIWIGSFASVEEAHEAYSIFCNFIKIVETFSRV